MPIYSIESGMAEALGHLKRVAQHFSDNGHLKIANELGKLSISIVNTFTEGIEQIPNALYQLDSEPDSSHISDSKSAIDNNAIQRQAAAALIHQVNAESAGVHSQSAALQRVSLQRIPLQSDQVSQPPSWAQTAAKLPPSMQGRTLYPPRATVAVLPGSKPNGSEDGDSVCQATCIAVSHADSVSPGMPNEAKAGVIRIHGKIGRDIIQFVTTRIHEGPLQEIRIDSRACVRVTFLHVAQALVFLKSNQDMEQMLGFGRFGHGYHVELADVIDWNDDHRRMNQPLRERRRLSFARKRLFADNMTPEKWRQDIRALAGPGNVDFLWVFNSGNATAVFTSTAVARQVLDIFNQWKMEHKEYSEVCVSYSSDPCEKELVLAKEPSRGARNVQSRRITIPR